MLYAVSWSQYWTAVSISLVLYYLYAGWNYFRPGLHKSHSGHRNMPGAAGGPLPSLQRELQAYIEQSALQLTARPELIFGLQRIASRYAAILNDATVEQLTQYILILCKDNPAVNLSENDIRQVWLV